MKGRALITGGAGFIGSHLADVLLARGFSVAVLDNLCPQVHAGAERDADGWPLYLDPRIWRFRGDIRDPDAFEAALSGATHLVHLAASVGVGQSMTNVADYTDNNVLATAMMLETLSRRPHTLQRMAVASSMSVYGEGAYRRLSDGAMSAPRPRTCAQLEAGGWDLCDEHGRLEPIATPETKPLHPSSIYAVNKRDHEEMVLTMGRALNIPAVALRLFNTFGSRQALSNPYTGVAAIFISRLLNNEAPMIFEDGEQLRDFVHVGDVADAFAAVLESPAEVWDVFNVGSGRSISIHELAVLLARLLRRPIAPVVMQRARFGDVRHCYADISKIGQAFGVRPTRSLKDGMAELIEWVAHVQRPVDRSLASLAELQAGGLLL